MVMQHAVEAALRADVQTPIGKGRHDLARWPCRELRLVPGQKDALALLVGEAVRDKALAAFTAIQAVPITHELPAPALQRGVPHAQRRRHRSGPCTSRNGLIEDLQGFAAIFGRVQFTSSSPQ
jgi:hypothetical protein